MRLFPVLLAIVVATGLYFVIIERDRTLEFLGVASAAEPAQTDAAPSTDAAAQAETEDVKLIQVVAQKSTAREVDSAVILRGQTEASREVDVRSETTSTVVSEPLRKGSFVEAGELICRLDPGTRRSTLAETRARLAEAQARRAEADSRIPEADARLTEAIARLAEAEVNQNAAQSLSEDGFASETRVKNADAAVAAAEAAVEAAKAGLAATTSGIQSADATIESAAASVAAAERELEKLEIRAPFAGILESDTAELGSLLQPGSLCATVIQLDPIKLVAFVPETEVNRVSTGALAGARLAAGGKEVRGTVSFLSRSADETTRTFRVEIEVPNKDLAVRDGQTAEILIAAPGEMAHLLPQSALTLDDDGRLGVRLVDDEGFVSFAPVRLMRDTADGVWLSGLAKEVNVIVIGQEYVTAGVKVAAAFREPSQ